MDQMARQRRTAPQHRPANEYQVAPATIAGSTLQPELRDLIERLPLWRRPGYLIRRLHQIHNALFLEECAGFDLTPVQYGLLTTLSMNPDADQNTLAQELGIDRTNVADVLIRLEQRGLVARRRSTADRRMVLAHLTAKGERLTVSMHGAMSRAQLRLVETLDPAEREAFVGVLLRLVDANNHVGRAPLR